MMLLLGSTVFTERTQFALADDWSAEQAIAAGAGHSQPQASQSAPPRLFGGTPPGNPVWQPLDTLELFAGREGSKQPQDLGVNANYGSRLHVNFGMPLVEDWGLGLQVGTSLNVTDNAVQVFERLGEATDRVQNFSTVGLFQRTDGGFKWGVGYDLLIQDSYDRFTLGQARAIVGQELSPTDEFGVWGTLPTNSSDGVFNPASGPQPVTLRSIAQGNLYWRHTWENTAELSLWAGGAARHGQINAVLGDETPLRGSFTFGSDLHLPLADWLAVYGAANFITPADTGTVDAFLGFAIYPARTAHGFRKRRFSPLLPLANSPWFAVDVLR